MSGSPKDPVYVLIHGWNTIWSTMCQVIIGQRFGKQSWLFTPVMLLFPALKIIKMCVNRFSTKIKWLDKMFWSSDKPEAGFIWTGRIPICPRPAKSLKILEIHSRESRGWYFMSILCDTDRDRQQQQPVSDHNSTTAVTVVMGTLALVHCLLVSFWSKFQKIII